MIVWLASYPRSGNTLLRTILKTCFDVSSYSDDPLAKGVSFSHETVGQFGHKELDAEWPKFYENAKSSCETYLVKTHREPIDDSPTIYVVRDGRSAVWSYVKFMAAFFPDAGRTLVEIILGEDYYGGWSDHYYRWVGRPGVPTLVVSYEDLVRGSEDLIHRLADFIEYNGVIQPWFNPMEELHTREPHFFRKGRTEWVSHKKWTAAIDMLFWSTHGSLMRELGWGQGHEEENSIDFQSVFSEIGKILRSRAERESALRATCDERRKLIEGLEKTCVERQALIDLLEQTCKEREALIGLLEMTCEERLQLIFKLSNGQG